MDVIDNVMQTTRSRAWKVLGTHGVVPVRTGLEIALGHRRFGRLLLGPRLDLLRKTILRTFLVGEAPPTISTLAKSLTRAEDEVKADLEELARREVIGPVDGHGGIASAYPFSATPTPHRVLLANGREVHGLSAVDALGIPLLAGGAGEIHSLSALSGRQIRIAIKKDRIAENQPEACIVGVAGDKKGSLFDAFSKGTQFFSSTKEWRDWLAEHRELRGNVLSLRTAMLVARHAFDDRFALAS
jgi:hypothetical protein